MAETHMPQGFQGGVKLREVAATEEALPLEPTRALRRRVFDAETSISSSKTDENRLTAMRNRTSRRIPLGPKLVCFRRFFRIFTSKSEVL